MVKPILIWLCDNRRVRFIGVGSGRLSKRRVIRFVILGAAAARTERIRLTSAVTVLSAEDPVRAFQNFATLDLLSRGRAEMIVNPASRTVSIERGSATMSTSRRTRSRPAVSRSTSNRADEPRPFSARS